MGGPRGRPLCFEMTFTTRRAHGETKKLLGVLGAPGEDESVLRAAMVDSSKGYLRQS